MVTYAAYSLILLTEFLNISKTIKYYNSTELTVLSILKQQKNFKKIYCNNQNKVKFNQLY